MCFNAVSHADGYIWELQDNVGHDVQSPAQTASCHSNQGGLEQIVELQDWRRAKEHDELEKEGETHWFEHIHHEISGQAQLGCGRDQTTEPLLYPIIMLRYSEKKERDLIVFIFDILGLERSRTITHLLILVTLVTLVLELYELFEFIFCSCYYFNFSKKIITFLLLFLLLIKIESKTCYRTFS